MAKTFKILHAPLHGASATNGELRRALRRRGVVAVAFSEAYRHGDYLGSRPRWRAVIGGTKRDANGRMVERDVIVLVKRRFKRLAAGVRFACPESTPLRIAPERHITWALHRVQGEKLAIIGFHPHAAVRHAWDSDRAEAYRQGMASLERLVERLRNVHGEDLDIVIVGDFNYPNVEDGRQYAPRALFESLGMNFIARGIDWIAWSKGLKREKIRVIAKAKNGQDHPWVEGTFSRA